MDDRVQVEKKPHADAWFIIVDGIRVGAASDRNEAAKMAIAARSRLESEDAL